MILFQISGSYPDSRQYYTSDLHLAYLGTAVSLPYRRITVCLVC